MNEDQPDKSAFWRRCLSRQEVILDVAAFGVTVLLATALRWQAKDLIWGLWISSLCVGYTHIVVSIVAGIRTVSGTLRIPALAGGLFLLGFFTVHFGMFHFVHSIFLNHFFPLVDSGMGFPDIRAIFTTALGSYWPFVLVNLWYRWRDFPKEGMSLAKKTAFFGPYLNVVRMHLLIFVFAGLYGLRLGNLAIYPVLAAYFFPWGVLLRRPAVKPS